MRDSLRRLQERISGRQMAILTQKIGEGALAGDAFAEAGFSPFECHLVAAGERSAQLETVFQHLSEFWSRQIEVRQALVTQLYYPILMLHAALFIAALSELAISSWPVVEFRLVEYFTIFYALGLGFYFFLQLTESNEAAQRFWMAVPIIGRALRTACSHRWVSALKLEFSAGIPLPDAVADAWRASGYVDSERLAAEAERELREGALLSTLVHHWRRLPRDWTDFIETGEISGALETALANLQAEAARDSTLAQQRLTEWTPKIASVLILIVIGILVLHTVWQGYIMPIVQLENMNL